VNQVSKPILIYGCFSKLEGANLCNGILPKYPKLPHVLKIWRSNIRISHQTKDCPYRARSIFSHYPWHGQHLVCHELPPNLSGLVPGWPWLIIAGTPPNFSGTFRGYLLRLAGAPVISRCWPCR